MTDTIKYKWVIPGSTPLYKSLDTMKELTYLYNCALVRCEGVIEEKDGIAYEKVTYVTSQVLTGWVVADHIEKVTFLSDKIVSTSTHTQSDQDADQYIVRNGEVEFNLCGQFCISAIAGTSIEYTLAKIQLGDPVLFKRIFNKSGNNGRTSIQDLMRIHKLFDTNSKYELLYDLLRDKVRSYILSPERLIEIMKNYEVIVGVKISNVSGKLKQSGTLHWILLKHIQVTGVNMGIVYFYNPFRDRMQTCSWDELYVSMGVPAGLCISKNLDFSEHKE